MSEEGKKLNEKTILNLEGYTIVKYLEFVVFLCYAIGSLLALAICAMLKVNGWPSYVVIFGCFAIFLIIGHKITEVKVNLRITEKGLEQTRLSGSKFCPEYRLIEWKNMSRYYPHGRSRGIAFLICVEGSETSDFRISMPGIQIFERQKHNSANLTDFQEEFSEFASEHSIPSGFFG